MSNYPESKDNLKVNTAGTDEMSAHAELHNDANEAINAIQDFVGTSDSDGSTTIVEGINIIAGQIEGLGEALGVDIDIDGTVTIDPDGLPIIVPEPDDSKFDVGAGTTNLNDATQMEAAIDTNATNIENVIVGLGGSVNPDGSIDINVDTSDKFDKGATSYADAKEMEDAIEANTNSISLINANGSYDDTELRGLIDDKFDTNDSNGEAPTTLKNARDMEEAIGANSTNISSLEQQFDSLLTDGIDGLEVELTSYLKKGDGLIAGNAKDLEDKINANTQAIDDLDIPVIDDLATKTEVSDGDNATLTAANAYTDSKVYDDTDLKGRVSTNEGNITALQAEQVTQNADIKSNKEAIEALDIPNVDEFTTKDYVDAADATKFDKGATGPTTLTTAELMEKAIDDNAEEVAKKYNAGVVPEDESRTYADAYALEQAVLDNAEEIKTNADAIETKVSFAVNKNDENLFCNNIVTLTQAEYDALTDRDPNTLYLAVDA